MKISSTAFDCIEMSCIVSIRNIARFSCSCPRREIFSRALHFLPYGNKPLKTLKSVPYERTPQTLGQHLKKRRLRLGLFQRDLRKRFGLEKETYANWEKDRRYPAMKHWPGIIEFLGHDPNPESKTLGERLLAYRRQHGMGRNALARQLGADETNLSRWEIDQRKPKCLLPFDGQNRTTKCRD
jgi:transcriptional regulator with XRE-family HTH domain